MSKHKCAYCGKPSGQPANYVKRAEKMGLNLYCGRKCAGLGRRVNKSRAQRKEEKWWYDAFWRLAMADIIKAQKAAAFKKDYAANPEKYRQMRIAQRENHRRHLSTPEYKAYKQRYDEKYRAKEMYGEHAESFLIIKQIESLINKEQSRFDRNCHNKTQQRRKLWKSLQRSISKTPSGQP